jgi:hypothetical protein
MFWKKFFKTNAQKGLGKANRHIKTGHISKSTADKLHDHHDSLMYANIVKYQTTGDKAAKVRANFERGQAMGYGTYAHTGELLKKIK